VLPDSISTTGLTGDEAARRLAADGRNEITGPAGDSLPRAIGRQLTDVVVLVLLAAAALTAAVGDATDTAVILAVVVLNTALGVTQEIRSSRALDALAQLTAPRAVAVRDGRGQEIDAADVVVDDVLELTAGDIVPADGTVIASAALEVDESMLTGESMPVDKGRGDAVSAGTVVTGGRGTALVTATAGATSVGRIARSLDGATTRTPVQRQLAVLGRRLALAAAVAAVVVGGLNLATGHSAEMSAVLAISLAVAAIPESLPAVVSLGLALAARRLSSAGILVRRLPAVEALGSVTVIAADKTGTLTSGQMSVQELWTVGTADAEAILLEAAVLCNDAAADGSPARHDDPLEVALVEAAIGRGLDVAALRVAWPRTDEQPFDAATRRMTTWHSAPDGSAVQYCKGSPEALLDPEWEAADAAKKLAEMGHRVLAVTRTRDDETEVLGLLALRDPPRTGASSVIAAFRAAGVRPVMITGDHRATALAIAELVGIAAEDVYARVLPEDKREIVQGLRAGGDVVAMTGDGVNDAPALRAADIGVSMGERATEVARQAASIVLTRDDLGAMVAAIREGRRMYDNLRRFLHYALSGGLAEIVVMLIGPAFGFPVPLQAGQLLWVNLLTHGLPGVAMGNEAPGADVLHRLPRPPGEQLLDWPTARRVGVLGAAIAATCLLVGAYAREAGLPWQSIVFMTLALSQLAAALALRPRRAGFWANPMLLAAVVLNVALAVLAVTWSPLRELLHTSRLTVDDVLLCASAAIVPGLIAWVQVRRQRPAKRAEPARPGR
jgi:Ca2+-transporting ATPase